MKRLLLILALFCLYASPLQAATWTGVSLAINYDASGGTTLATTTSLSVTSGQFLVACAYNQDNAAMTMSDSVNGAWTSAQKTYDFVQIFYVLSSGAGTITPTVSYSGTATKRGVWAGQYTVVGTPTLQTTSAADLAGTSAAPSTNSMSATGSANLLVWGCEFNTSEYALTSPTVAGSGSGVVDPPPDNGGNQFVLAAENYSSFTGAIAGTLSNSDATWVITGAVFDATVAGSTTTGRATLLGAGK